MRKIPVAFLLLPLALLFWGCPLESEYDLGTAMLPEIDKRILGKWENKTDSTNMYLLIEAESDPEYPQYVNVYIMKSATQAKDDEDTELYYAQFARVNGNDYLVVEYYDELWSEYVEHYYYYYKVVDGNNIIVKDVNESYKIDEEIASGDELQAHFINSQPKADFLINERKYKKI